MKKLIVLFMFLLSTALMAEPVYIKMETNRGDIILELNPEKAPLSVANFVQYTVDGFYNNTVFHRVINSFMIQGGGFTIDLDRKKTREPIKNEATNGLKNTKGTIAMARTAAPHSATSQFYINVSDNPALDHTGQENGRAWGYTVFGKVISGMDVVNIIQTTPTEAAYPFKSDVPIKNMVIKSVKALEKKPEEVTKAVKESE